jgi:hypothetical protein
LWVFTAEGFFSAVHDKFCNRDELMIRARCKDDLCQLSKKLHGSCDESQILEIGHADYRFRMKVPKQAWSQYLAEYALSLDYANVKDSIIPDGDHSRKDAYYQVWLALHRWQMEAVTC